MKNNSDSTTIRTMSLILKRIFQIKRNQLSLFMLFTFFLLQAESTYASSGIEITQQKQQITGRVVDESGETLIGVSILIKGTVQGVTTDLDGNFSINAKIGDVLEFSCVGMKPIEHKITKSNITIVMSEDSQGLSEVVVVGFGKQKKESLVSAITTVNVKDIKGPTSNLTTMLAGRIAGVIAYQRSGEPGQDNAEFFIRGVGSFGAGKVNPLILIDGIESSNTDLARLQPDDIEAFSVLKDATASAVYGSRGANGVILVNTKSGKEAKTKFNFRVENSISSNTRNFQFADNITYMNLANEAALTRNPLASLVYSQSKIEHTMKGDDPLLYPNNNWIDQLISNYTMNQRYNLNVSGGGKVARFYIAGTFNVDNGVLKSGDTKKYDNNIKLKNYSIRTNTNLNITPTTEAIIRVYGQFDDYSGPIGGGGRIFQTALWTNPVMFPATYPSSLMPYSEHTLFGNAIIPGRKQLFNNPYAQMVSGYQTYNTSTIMAQFELKQKFDFITPGLSARAMGYTQRYAYFDTSRQSNPFYYRANAFDGQEMFLTAYNDGGPNSIGTVGTEYLNYHEGEKRVNSTYYGELSLNYERIFKETHNVTGMLIGTIRNHINGNAGNLQASLPARNLGLAGRFAYGYNSRYFLEFNFGLNGSERFAKNNRWGFFPSVGAGWNLANEEFWGSLKNTISNFKFRGSYGLVGNDQIGRPEDRFFYMSEVYLNGGGYSFGKDYNYYRPGVNTGRYGNDKIGWETSRQMNVGFDMSIWDLNITAEYFQQKRSNILMNRSFIPGTLGLQAGVAANVGKVDNSGVDLSLDYNKSFGNGMWIQSRANFTYAHSEMKVYDEPTYPGNEYYRTQVGLPVNTVFGLVAERLFVDEAEVANSPKQTYSKYGAGDIKYRDMNGDGQITDADRIPIGYPTSPEINYGFGATIGWKGFDANFFFQGSARSSFFIDQWKMSPFVIHDNMNNSGIWGAQNGLSSVIANDHWSEDNRNIYAFWPRLSDTFIDNNNRPSTWWMRNGAFLRLKSVEIGYNVPENTLKKFGISNLRVYVNGTNLFSISKFKMWDTEMGGDGMGYPIQAVYNIGIALGL